jgi:hypothetical protein
VAGCLDGGGEGEAGKEGCTEVDAAQVATFSTFLNWLVKFTPAGTVIRTTRRNERESQAKGSVIYSDSRSS